MRDEKNFVQRLVPVTPNAFVTGIFCVVAFCGTVAKPPQNGAKQKMSC
jgi:hypothetical protein